MKMRIIFGLQYHDGLNEDILPFNPQGVCEPEGLYYARKDIFAFISYGPWIREVTLCSDSKIYKDPDRNVEKWKTNKFILGSRRRIDVKIIQELLDGGGGQISTLLKVKP